MPLMLEKKSEDSLNAIFLLSKAEVGWLTHDLIQSGLRLMRRWLRLTSNKALPELSKFTVLRCFPLQEIPIPMPTLPCSAFWYAI
jgi:hypothetical protein